MVTDPSMGEPSPKPKYPRMSSGRGKRKPVKNKGLYGAATAASGIPGLAGKAGKWGLGRLAGGAMGALNGVGGAAFGVIGLIQLMQMLSGAGEDRQADDVAGTAFLNDPMVGEEMSQMATREHLNSRVGVSGEPMSMQDDLFLQDVMAQNAGMMRNKMQRTPPTTAELAAAAGLL